MLSVKYHIAYWAAAASSTITYQVLAFYASFTDVILRVILGPLVGYLLFSSWTWQRSPKNANWVLYMHQAAVAQLLVAIGSVAGYFHAAEIQDPKPTAVIHTLLSFMILGTLESVRQNRHDIEPASIFQVLRGPRSRLARFAVFQLAGYFAALIAFDLLLVGILKLGDAALDKTCGISLRGLLPFYERSRLDVKGRFGSALVSFYLAGPFADMAETVFYVACRKFIPEWQGWMPRERPLLREDEPLSFLDTEQGVSSFVWVLYVTLLYYFA